MTVRPSGLERRRRRRRCRTARRRPRGSSIPSYASLVPSAELEPSRSPGCPSCSEVIRSIARAAHRRHRERRWRRARRARRASASQGSSRTLRERGTRSPSGTQRCASQELQRTTVRGSRVLQRRGVDAPDRAGDRAPRARRSGRGHATATAWAAGSKRGRGSASDPHRGRVDRAPRPRRAAAPRPGSGPASGVPACLRTRPCHRSSRDRHTRRPGRSSPARSCKTRPTRGPCRTRRCPSHASEQQMRSTHEPESHSSSRTQLEAFARRSSHTPEGAQYESPGHSPSAHEDAHVVAVRAVARLAAHRARPLVHAPVDEHVASVVSRPPTHAASPQARSLGERSTSRCDVAHRIAHQARIRRMTPHVRHALAADDAAVGGDHVRARVARLRAHVDRARAAVVARDHPAPHAAARAVARVGARAEETVVAARAAWRVGVRAHAVRAHVARAQPRVLDTAPARAATRRRMPSRSRPPTQRDPSQQPVQHTPPDGTCPRRRAPSCTPRDPAAHHTGPRRRRHRCRSAPRPPPRCGPTRRRARTWSSRRPPAAARGRRGRC
jgi:hypothetical protein